MGYDRAGHKVVERIEQAIADLLRKGAITEYGSQIVLSDQEKAAD